jgi:hypothetical protein
MFAYSCGIITCKSRPTFLDYIIYVNGTDADPKGIFPVAFFFHRNPWRREPMLAAVIVLQLALVLFMQVELFTAMVVARFLQGGASSVVFSGKLQFSSAEKAITALMRLVGMALMLVIGRESTKCCFV